MDRLKILSSEWVTFDNLITNIGQSEQQKVTAVSIWEVTWERAGDVCDVVIEIWEWLRNGDVCDVLITVRIHVCHFIKNTSEVSQNIAAGMDAFDPYMKPDGLKFHTKCNEENQTK